MDHNQDNITLYEKKVKEYYTESCESVLYALTISDVRWREVVIDKKGGVFGHTQVNDVRSRLQGSHCLLMSYLLQTGGIHLHTHEDTHCIKQHIKCRQH